VEAVGSSETPINNQYNISKYGNIQTTRTYQISRYRLSSIEMLYRTHPVQHQKCALRSCLHPEMGYVPQGMHSEQAASLVSKDYFALRRPTCSTHPHCFPLLREAWRPFCITRVYSLCCLGASDLRPGHITPSPTPEDKRDIFVSWCKQSGGPKVVFFLGTNLFCTTLTPYVIKSA
jgi:hypothetical protein